MQRQVSMRKNKAHFSFCVTCRLLVPAPGEATGLLRGCWEASPPGSGRCLTAAAMERASAGSLSQEQRAPVGPSNHAVARITRRWCVTAKGRRSGSPCCRSRCKSPSSVLLLLSNRSTRRSAGRVATTSACHRRWYSNPPTLAAHGGGTMSSRRPRHRGTRGRGSSGGLTSTASGGSEVAVA
jgi:hypothetical protein